MTIKLKTLYHMNKVKQVDKLKKIKNKNIKKFKVLDNGTVEIKTLDKETGEETIKKLNPILHQKEIAEHF